MRTLRTSWLVMGILCWIGLGAAYATKTPEQVSREAYEQVQGRAVGRGEVSENIVQARYGLKPLPQRLVSPLPTFKRTPPPSDIRSLGAAADPALSSDGSPDIIEALAKQRVRGVVLCSMFGLSIGVGFGYLAGKSGHREQ
jgi:hypothetical protein